MGFNRLKVKRLYRSTLTWVCLKLVESFETASLQLLTVVALKE